MSNQETTKKTVKTTPKVSKPKVTTPKKESVEVKVEPKVKETTMEVVKELPLNLKVEVVNTFHGELTYISSRTNQRFKWNEFGTSQFFTLEELLTMRNSQVAFFEKNWITIVGDNVDEILEFLQVTKYYENVPTLGELERLFELSLDELETLLLKLPESVKGSIAKRAADMIENKTLDSMSKIELLERVLNYELIER